MKIYAAGEAQSLDSPGTSIQIDTPALVVGLIDLGNNNGQNEFGWSGLKAVVELEGKRYVLDFVETSHMETDDGIEITSPDTDSQLWWPNKEDASRYNLEIISA